MLPGGTAASFVGPGVVLILAEKMVIIVANTVVRYHKLDLVITRRTTGTAIGTSSWIYGAVTLGSGLD